MEITVGQVWRHKRTGKQYRIERIDATGIHLRELERTPVSPPEGTLRVINGHWLEFFMVVYEPVS